MKGTKEFYDLQAQFEKDIDGMPLYIGGKVERSELNGEHNQWYTHHTVNELFIAYMWGYQFSKTIHRD